jgi:hypothetical protein
MVDPALPLIANGLVKPIIKPTDHHQTDLTSAMIRPEHHAPPRPPAPTGPDTPSWDATATAEEGLWARHGWAGRNR